MRGGRPKASEGSATKPNIPISAWNYRAQDDSIRHIGPMAQDFHRAFGLSGDDRTHISPIDTDGVALAAIQGLDRELGALRHRIGEPEPAAASSGGPPWAALAALVGLGAFALGLGLGVGLQPLPSPSVRPFAA